MDTYDWSLFQVRSIAPCFDADQYQGALRLVHVTSNLTSRISQFDKTLRQVLVEQRAQLFGENCVADCREQVLNRRYGLLTRAALTLNSYVERNRAKFSVTDDDPERVAQLLLFLLSISPDGMRASPLGIGS